MSRISRTRGKMTELAVARFFKAKRNHFEHEDLNHPVLSIEAKHRKQLPKSITNWMSQAVAAAPAGKLPCVVVHEAGRHQHASLSAESDNSMGT